MDCQKRTVVNVKLIKEILMKVSYAHILKNMFNSMQTFSLHAEQKNFFLLYFLTYIGKRKKEKTNKIHLHKYDKCMRCTT